MAANPDDFSDATMEHDSVEMLVIAPSLNHVNELTTVLRNAGIAVHPHQVEALDELTDTMRRRRCDLILCFGDQNHNDIHATVEALRESDSDAILIYLNEDDDPANPAVELIGQGVADIVNPANKLHFQQIVKRELRNLRLRRRVNALQTELDASEQRCVHLIEHSRDAIAYVHEGMHIHANPVYLRMFGYADDDLTGTPLLDLIEPDELAKAKKFLRRLSKTKEPLVLDTRCRNADGAVFATRMEFSPAHMAGEPCTQITIRDQGDTRELEERLAQLQRTDPQTGLLNREAFIECCEERLANEADRRNRFVLLTHVDNLREVYHISGIRAADSVIRDIAGIIQSLSPDEAVLAHIGDFAFGMLVTSASLAEAETLAEEIRKGVEEHIFENTQRFVSPTCSIGIVECGLYPRNAGHEYIGLAYRACEAAAGMGGNRVALYNDSLIEEEMIEPPDAQPAPIESDEVLTRIRHALDNDGFNLVYQPIVSLQGDTRENYAVMLRLAGEQGRTIMPEEFLGPATDARLMAQVDRWVIKNAIEELASQRREGRKINFFLNISAQGIRDQEFLLWVCDCLRDCQAKGAWIAFQLKEEDVRENIQAAKQLIDGQHKIRCQAALDRFGRTPQSRGLLKHVDFDFVKLAPEFMDELAENQERQEELSAANELAQSFDVKTIATAVEDANSLAVLWTIGVNYIQGYFLQDPSDTITFSFNGA